MPPGARGPTTSAVGYSGIILHWQGSTWTQVSSGTLSTLNAIWGAGANDVWAVGVNGAIQRWNGTRWANTASTTSWRGVWGSAADDVWLVGDSGETWRWNGTTFTKTSTANTLGVSGRSRNEVYGWGRNTVSRWNGSTWTDLALPNPNGRYGLYMSLQGGATGDIWVSADNEVLHWNGTTWSAPERLIGSSLLSIAVTATDAWAVGGRDQVFRRPAP